VVAASLKTVAALLTRQVVTPVADPRDGNGEPLQPAVPAPALVLPSQVELTPAELDALRALLAEAGGRMEQTAADERMVPPVP